MLTLQQIGTASEHHVFYQYSLVGASNHYIGLAQTETVRLSLSASRLGAHTHHNIRATALLPTLPRPTLPLLHPLLLERPHLP